MRDLFAFERRLQVDDGYGNMESGDFAEVFRCAAAVTPLKGGEAVTASRLTGVQPYTVTIRYFLASSTLTTAWQARDVRTGAVYAITTAVARDRHDYIDMTCTSGKAA